MFTISKIEERGKGFVVLQNSENTTKATISLNEGGRLEGLNLENKTIIKEVSNFSYKDSYASSVLFPFANRIEKGKYFFNKKEYGFHCNDNNKNALHGLVYDKAFQVLKKIESINFSTVVLSYTENNKSIGFPFTYEIQLTYTLYKDDLTLAVKIENTDTKEFPFVLGWHPYFFSNDFSKSFLRFDSDKKIKFDKNLITKNVIDYQTEKEFVIDKKQLDDCFILNSDTLEFITPDYEIEITTNQIENYLQLYTPKDLPLIAIEPMTGVSNSFNNKIGLQTLKPNQIHSLIWNIKLN